MTGPQFREHLYQLAIFRHELAAFAGVGVRTVARWCAEHAPLYAVRLADAAAGVVRGSDFDGWQARRDTLAGPTGERYQLADVRAVHWLRQLVRQLDRDAAELRQQLSDARAELDRLRAQPARVLPCAAPAHQRNRAHASPAVDDVRRVELERLRDRPAAGARLSHVSGSELPDA